jgi:selenocysteine lyase/cysteine desulfurase
VVVPDNEFPSNLLPWRNLARRGVELRLVPVPPSGELTPGDVAPLVDRRTRLIAISWVGFLSGFRIDLAAMAELAHSRGCLLSLDAIQGLGAFPIDVRASGVDFLSADGHKWMLGPEGAGIFYCQLEHLNLLQPLGLGWNSLASAGFDPASTAIKTNAARYEGGATNMPGMLGLGASLRLLNEQHGLSPDSGTFRAGGLSSADGPSSANDLPRPSASPVAAAILENVAELEDLLTVAGFICHLPVDPKHRSGIMRVSWPEADAVGESVYLEARKHCIARDVVFSVRGGCIRISPHAYNNRDDHERLVAALVSFGLR